MTDQPSLPPGSPDQPPPYHSPYGQTPGAPPPPGYEPPPGHGAGGPGYGPGGPGYGAGPGAAPGYGNPYGGAYDPRWGYGPPGVPQHPHGGPVTPQDPTWGLWCYVGTLLAGFWVPLIIYFVKKNESPFIRHHAAQALNTVITYWLHMFIAAAFGGVISLVIQHPAPVIVCVVVTLLFHMVANFVLMILGAIRANKGVVNRFPTWLCFRMVR